MTITAIELIKDDDKIEITRYESKTVSARTLLKALRSVASKYCYSPVIEISGKRFYTFEIHTECQGCRTVEAAEWFLKNKVAA